MRQGQQHRRGRGRHNNNNNNNPRKGQNPLARSYESNGPDVKVRGTPAHVAEKYMSLARDALSSGDPVLAENYLQHAEHYNRIILAYREQQGFQGGDMGNQSRMRQDAMPMDGDEGDDDAGSEDFGQSEQPMVTRFPQQDHPPRSQHDAGQGGQRGEEHFSRGFEQSAPGHHGQGQGQGHPQQQRFRERHDRQHRNDRFDRGDRRDRHDRGERFDRGERHDRNGDRPERFDRVERQGGERDRHFERPGQSERPVHAERNLDDRGNGEYRGGEGRSEPRHEPRHEPRPEPRPEPRAEPRPEGWHEPRAEGRPPEPRPQRERSGEEAPPTNGNGSTPARGEGRRRERFAQSGEDQPDFLRRPVRRQRRDSEPAASDVPAPSEEPSRE